MESDMRFEYIFVANAATILDDGTFNVIGGGFDTVTAPSFPAAQPAMVLIARVLFESQELGREHPFVAEVVDQAGRPLFQPALTGTITPQPNRKHPSQANWMTVCLNCHGIMFPAPGVFSFRLSIGEQIREEVKIEAVLGDKPA
jgi:hypothetical protein